MCLIVVILSIKVLLLYILLYTIIVCTSSSAIKFFSVSVTRFFQLNFVFYKIFFCFSFLLIILEQTVIFLYALSSIMFSHLLFKKVIYLFCVQLHTNSINIIYISPFFVQVVFFFQHFSHTFQFPDSHFKPSYLILWFVLQQCNIFLSSTLVSYSSM